ncbi:MULTISPECIES: DUF6447 family protein [unclassified Pannonibacter]|uniref:DUF6447 family protein n=1 Tax=unclassified Pannonibacter TaxID=2627228 RepID=UPI001648DDDD|nr:MULTISPECIES: DUF6447 family protein [unclassified Pannonibacter]
MTDTFNGEPKVTIDGKDYAIDTLSQDALNQLSSINIVDRRIADLQQEMSILQTARNAYAAALAAALPRN